LSARINYGTFVLLGVFALIISMLSSNVLIHAALGSLFLDYETHKLTLENRDESVFSEVTKQSRDEIKHAVTAPATPANEKISDTYIVVLQDKMDGQPSHRPSAERMAEEAKKHGAEVLHIYEHALNGFAIRANEQALQGIQNNPNISYIEQDQKVSLFAQTLPKGINRVDGDLSSTRSGNHKGTVNVDIAILDTGIQLSHKDLHVYKNKSFITGTTSGSDDHGHGTHVAGIAAAKDNYSGVVGMAPGARLWAIKVLDQYGSGSLSTVIAGIDYVTQYASQIEVANISAGCSCTSSALDMAIQNSVAAGVTYTVAAGNSAKDASTFSPANHPDVITVSAIADSDGKCGGSGSSTSYGADDSFASFSNYGSVVDIAAPGVKIYSTYKGSSYATMSGTSMAAPHVAGAAALYMSAHGAASPADVKNTLLAMGSTPATTCDGKGHGYFKGDPDSFAEPLLYANPL
jgi:subtilisin